jgi:hypothetical protein
MACGTDRPMHPQGGCANGDLVHNLPAAGGGVQPFHGLILDGKGNLFGVTSNFGKYGGGTAFEIAP